MTPSSAFMAGSVSAILREGQLIDVNIEKPTENGRVVSHLFFPLLSFSLTEFVMFYV